MTEPNQLLTLVSPEVMRIWGDKGRSIDEPHLDWIVGYAPVADPYPEGRVVFGTIHAATEDSVINVTVASVMLFSTIDDPGENFATILKESHALESLWDTVRIAAGATAGLLGIDISIPREAPEPDLNELKKAEEADQDSADLDQNAPEA